MAANNPQVGNYPTFGELHSLADIEANEAEHTGGWWNYGRVALGAVGDIATQYTWGMGLASLVSLVLPFSIPWMSTVVAVGMSGAIGVLVRHLLNRWYTRNLDLDGVTRAFIEQSENTELTPKTREELRAIITQYNQNMNHLLALSDREKVHTEAQLADAIQTIQKLQGMKTQMLASLGRPQEEVDAARKQEQRLRQEMETLQAAIVQRKRELAKTEEALEAQQDENQALKRALMERQRRSSPAKRQSTRSSSSSSSSSSQLSTTRRRRTVPPRQQQQALRTKSPTVAKKSGKTKR